MISGTHPMTLGGSWSVSSSRAEGLWWLGPCTELWLLPHVGTG